MLERTAIQKQYPLWKMVLIAIGDMHELGWRYLVFSISDILIQIIVPVLLLVLPAQIIRLLEDDVSLSSLLGMIALILFVILVLNVLRTYLHHRIEVMGHTILESTYWSRLQKASLHCSISKLEDHKQRERFHEAQHALRTYDGESNYDGVVGMYMYLDMLLVNLGGFLAYALMAASLHVFLFVLLFFTSIISCYAKAHSIRYTYEHMGAFWENNNRFWYLKNESINMAKAKDIRMYHLYDWFKDLLNKNTAESIALYDAVKKHTMYSNEVVALMGFLRDGGAYLFLIWQLMQGNLMVSQFVLYIGVVAGFSGWITQIVESYTRLKQISAELAVFQATMSDMEERPTGEVPAFTHIDSIVFEDICFGYEEGSLLFDHFSCTLHAHTKLALVGINGAGKTTLMKLLCGLYPLQKGRILVNGVDIAALDPRSYRRMLSILFQDVQALPFSIAKNVACTWSKEDIQQLHGREMQKMYERLSMEEEERTVHYDEQRVITCLQQAGLWEKVCRLPKGIHTSLTQVLDGEGISLSGGELQRLMLARALYKDSSVLILDEPTAALDPIAESELYEEYARLCEGRMSIFISHRLSSTRFCDRILFLENGRILEEGSHEELMRQQGRYAQMYQVQAHYYQKEVAKHEAGL